VPQRPGNLPGQNRELSAEEVAANWPDATVAEQEYSTTEVFEYNITHNLTPMADAAGVYEALWRPDEHGWETARDITPALEAGLVRLMGNPEAYKALNPRKRLGFIRGATCVRETVVRSLQEVA